MKTRATLNKRFHAILNELKLKEMKGELVHQVSEGRCTSSADLTDAELGSVIAHLEDRLPKGKARTEQRDAADVMRKKIFSLCRDMGYISGFSTEDQKMNKAVVYGLVLKKGYAKKSLMAYTEQELPKLVSQFEGMRRNNNKAAASKAVAELKKELGL